jgi:hypothetical protein
VEDVSRDIQIQELTYKKYNEKTYDCEYCQKKFNSRAGKCQHKKICKKKNNKSELDELKETVEILKQSNEELRNIVLNNNTPLISNNTTNHIITNNVTNNIINIQLNKYGDEDISHLTHEFLSYCLLNPRKGLPNLIENIHYNKDVPCNHNLKYKSTKQNLLEKYVEEGWIDCDASNTLEELIKKGYKILNSHFAEHYMNDPTIYEDEMKQRAYERFRFLSDTTSIEYFAVKRELRLLVKNKTMFLLASPDNQDQIDV